MMANIVMLGFLAAIYDLVSAEALRKAVLTSVPAPTREMNALAFERGSEYGKATRKSRAKQGRLPRN
jgi:Pyruvate/2-oxoacid:ferredoxin oxidoreductase gamma subunit